VRDRYPAYVSWESFEKIQNMLRDNYAEYDRNKTRGVPREGAALLHGIIYCGACGHKMLVQYKSGARYICNHLRQQYGVPVCQYIPADPVDAEAVAAFFTALAPAELDAFAQAMAVRRAADAAALKAQAQQVERLRYRAALAERQFDQVDPDNRLVAAELERRWEETLRDLRQAEAALAAAGQDAGRVVPFVVGPDLQAAFAEVGRRLPDLWQQSALTTARKKALLRCLIDKVVIHRAARDTVAMRIVWRGGATSAATVPVTVGSLADLSRSREMEADIIARARAGESDPAIAAALTAGGHRSPLRNAVLRSTVQAIRLRHRILHKPSQSHQRRIPGCLTVSQLTARLSVTTHWIYDRIHNGTIAITPDAQTGLYLFPDAPQTLSAFRKLKAGKLERLTFGPRSAC
jgi:Recombinase zinc beta ribbon domain